MKIIAADAIDTGAENQKVLQIANDADLAELAGSGALEGVDRIELVFPKFTDGRAFSQAVLLRRRYGFAGDIAALVGLRNIATGDTLCNEDFDITLEPPTFPEPVISMAIEPKSKNDRDKMSEGLARLAEEDPTEEVELLLEGNDDDAERAALIVGLLAERRIPARVAWGLPLRETDTSARLQPLLQVYDLESRLWNTVDQHTGANGWPEDTMLWSIGPKPVLAIDRNPRGILEFSVTRSLADSLATAKKRLEVRDRALVAYSLLALPLQTQGTYKILLLVPVGAFIMLLLRNIVGIKTFGTFMPVLIALAFNWTGVVAGVILFVIVISLGLLVRFYMERLKLLLVPRLTAVLIVVVLLMALVSVVSNKLGFEIGLNVALFPMIIMTMTIERVSVAWEERSPGFAIRQALGSLVIASLAYIVMGETHMQHIVFVFPELLLVLLALTLVLGRYSGYRLTELFRFRALAREKPANEGQGG